MYLQCVLILALSLVQNEAAERSSQRPGPKIFRSGSPKAIQESFNTAAELAKLLQRVKKEFPDKKDQLQPQSIEASTQEDNTLKDLLNAIQKKIDDKEGIRIHIIKNADVLDKYKKDLGSRALFIDNPVVLEKYVSGVKKQKNDDQFADFEKIFLSRRNAVFRLEDPSNENHNERSKDIDPINHGHNNLLRKRSEGGISRDVSKRFNKVTNRDRVRNLNVKQRDPIESRESREARNKVRKNRGYKSERESRWNKRNRGDRGSKKGRADGYKNDRESHGSNKREFKDYPEFQPQGANGPARSSAKTTMSVGYHKQKSTPRDYDEFRYKKGNEDDFDDGRGKKKDNGWSQSNGSDRKRKPKMNYDEKPNRNFDNKMRRPRDEEDWAPTIRGSNNIRSSNNKEGYGFGNTPIPFNRPRNIYANEGE